MIKIGIPSKGRLRKDTLKVFSKKKLKILSERGERDLFGFIKVYKNINKMLSAYPNPFLINDYNQVGDDGHVRLIYSNPKNDKSNIDIFDFAMDRVVQLNNSHMVNNTESEVIWNGKNEYGVKVANGVYFCRLSLNKKYYWTKLAVVN